MAKRRKARRAPKIQPAVTDLSFTIPAAGGADADSRSFIDTAKELSKVNRRGYSQARMYAYQGLTFIWRQNTIGAAPMTTLELNVRTAGNTWVVQNAHVKGEALWHQMQELVTEDNPSVRGKWHDYKIVLSSYMTGNKILAVKDGDGDDFESGEWNYSTYVLPQHDVAVAGDGSGIPPGEPLAAIEVDAALIGVDTTSKRSLVKAYEESRATVQADMPNVPAGMVDSFFNLLTDSGSQEPELAQVIIDENDNPPYKIENYPGGGTNAPTALTVGYGAISAQEVDGRIGGFVAPCGLLEIEILGFDATGAAIPTADMPAIDVLLHVAPGMYKGVASVPMGQ